MSIVAGYAGKRLLDLTLTLALLPILLPVLAAVAVLVRIFIGSPVLFRQQRPGLGGRLFEIVKFRTMTDRRDANGALLPDGERLTRFGRLLRASSLDELPEIINVMRGEMSFVGPRPLLPQYLPLYTPHQRRRHEVRPGLTGLAQVSGRNALTWPEKFDLDVRYVERASLRLDVQILWRTVSALVSRQGISAPGDATMPVFTGAETHAAARYAAETADRTRE